jgi:hypothetical protein
VALLLTTDASKAQARTELGATRTGEAETNSRTRTRDDVEGIRVEERKRMKKEESATQAKQ